MNEVYLVYKADNWHSHASKDVIGIATSMTSIITICKEKASEEGSTIGEDQLFNLQTYNQTQGYAGEGEFSFETIEVDKLF